MERNDDNQIVDDESSNRLSNRKLTILSLALLFLVVLLASILFVVLATRRTTPTESEQAALNGQSSNNKCSLDTNQQLRDECHARTCKKVNRIEEWLKFCKDHPLKSDLSSNSMGSMSSSSGDSAVANLDYRLPRSLKPTYYELTLKPFFNVTPKPSNSDGYVVIRFECLEDTSRLILHMNELKVDDSSLELYEVASADFDHKRPNKSSLISLAKNFKWQHDQRRQFFIADFGSMNDKKKKTTTTTMFRKGKQYVVTIGFVGYLKDDNVGFYASSYTDSDGSKK